MKSVFLIVLALLIGISVTGCAKKEAPLEEFGEPVSMESLSTMNTTAQIPTETKPGATLSQAPIEAANLAPLPPTGPYKPTALEIQSALKNSGYYSGNVDGKIGPMTKKAIADFQKANGLQADGKVGTKTWGLLSTYLNAPAAQPQGKKKP